MDAFRNYTAGEILSQSRTEAERRKMDYIFGWIYLIATVLGFIVNTLLINYYWRHNRTWMQKFYYALAIASWLFMMTRGVPDTYILLSNLDHDNLVDMNFYDIIVLFSNLDVVVQTIILAAIIFVQYTNIFHPGWTILNGPSTCWQRIIIVGVILCFILFATAIPVTCLNLTEFNLFAAVTMVYLTKLMLVITSLCVYFATRIKFRRLERELSIEVQEKVRREFKLVNYVMAIWCFIWIPFGVSYPILYYIKSKYCSYLPIVAMIEFLTVSCAILRCDHDVWEFTFKNRRRQEYTTLN